MEKKENKLDGSYEFNSLNCIGYYGYSLNCLWILSGKDIRRTPPVPREILYILSQKIKQIMLSVCLFPQQQCSNIFPTCLPRLFVLCLTEANHTYTLHKSSMWS